MGIFTATVTFYAPPRQPTNLNACLCCRQPLGPLAPPGVPGGGVPCPGATFCKELLGSPDNLLPLVGADLVEDGPQVELSVIWDAGGGSTPTLCPKLKTLLHTCGAARPHEVPHHLKLQGVQHQPNAGSYLPAPLHGLLPSLMIAALRAVYHGLGSWPVSGNLTSQGLRIR